MSDRLSKLHQMLEKHPTDPFLLYGIALEYKNTGNHPQALTYLAKTLQADPTYCYAYFQQGQIHEAANDPAAAKTAYQYGIAAATKKNDTHAKSELEGALSMLD